MKKVFRVDGMYCSACENLVVNTAKEVKNVTEASVNLLTNSLTITYSENLNEKELFQKIKTLGYSISPLFIGNKKEQRKRKISTALLIIKIFLIFLLTLFVTILNFNNFKLSYSSVLKIYLAGSFLVSILSFRIYQKGFVSLFKKNPGMETLISISSLICLGYGTYVCLATNMPLINGAYTNKFMLSNMMILFFVTLGNFIEELTKKYISKKLDIYSSSINVETLLKKDDRYVKTKIDKVRKGDVLLINPGDYIPLDGVILEGSGYVEETAINGEATPVFKNKKDKILGGSLLQNGTLVYKVDKEYIENDMGKIATLLQGNSGGQLSFSKIINKITRWFIPAILAISLIVFLIWILVTKGDVEKSLNYGLSTLVVTCPCALGLASPLCLSIGTALGLKNDIIFKSGDSIEKVSKVNFFAFDKTKTLTKGILEICFHKDFSKNKDLNDAIYSLEKSSKHPLAMAIEKFFKIENCKETKIEKIQNILGEGIEGFYKKKKIVIGNFALIKKNGYKGKEEKEINKGSSKVYIIFDGKLCHYFEMQDQLKNEANFVIKELKTFASVAIISGDNESSTKLIANKLGIEKFYSNISPFKKENIIEDSKNKSLYTCMIGDGINDSLAIKSCDLGISFGNASTVAISKADIIILDSNLEGVLKSKIISTRIIKRIKINIIFSFVYNAILIPIAAGAFSSLGLILNPIFSSLAMALSSLSVIISSLLLFTIKLKYRKE